MLLAKYGSNLHALHLANAIFSASLLCWSFGDYNCSKSLYLGCGLFKKQLLVQMPARCHDGWQNKDVIGYNHSSLAFINRTSNTQTTKKTEQPY